jgi:hypothetical protein
MTFDDKPLSEKPLSPAAKRWRAVEAERRENERRQEAFGRVCARMLEGKPLHEIAGTDGLPKLETLLDWIEDDDDFRHRYKRARRYQFEIAADELVKTVDRHAGKGAAALKARIAARRWRDKALALRDLC